VKHKSLYTMIYATLFGLVCALVPTAVGTWTKPLREANAKVDEIKNTLVVLGIPFDGSMPSKELVAFFADRVVREARGGLTLYYAKLLPGSAPEAIAVPFAGRGVWGPIRGYLALAADMRTIEAVTFYYHEETPGLGGEISTQAFTSRFVGKKIVDAEGKPSFRILRAGASRQNEIDGISGATLTGGKVETIMNALAAQIVKEDIHVGQ
jgi:Na+-transporting NADH:ubiquinone oxidoreductase subunit C